MLLKNLILFLVIISTAAPCFANDPTQDELIVYLNSLKHRPEYKKFIYFASEMAQEQQRYKDNPKNFVDTHYVETGESYTLQLKESEVLDKRKAVLEQELEGFTLSDSKLFRSLQALSSFAPPGVSTGLDLMNINLSSEPYTPNIADIDQDFVANILQSDNSSLAKYVDDEFLKQFGVTPENITQLPEVRWDKAFELIDTRQTDIEGQINNLEDTQSKNNELLKYSLGETEKLVKEAVEMMTAQKTAADEEQDRVEKEREYQKRRANILGGISGLGSILRMSGHEREAKAVDSTGKIAGILMDIDSTEDYLSLAAFGGYAAALELALGLFSSGPSFEEALMESIQELFDAIEDVRLQMHARFDRIDTQLSRILLKVDWNQKLTTERLRSLQEDLRDLKRHQGLMIQKLDQLQLSLRREVINQHAVLCGISNETISYAKITFDSPSLFEQQCLNSIVHSATTNSLYESINITPLPAHDFFIPTMHGERLLDNLPTLVEGLQTSSSPLTLSTATHTPAVLNKVPHHKLWEESAHQYIELFDNYPEYRRLFLPSYTKKIREAGGKLVLSIQNLILDGRTLREQQLFQILDNYQDTLLNSVDFISDKLQQIAEEQPLGFNLNTMPRSWPRPTDLTQELLPLTSPRSFSIDTIPQYEPLNSGATESQISMCEGHKRSKLPKLIYKPLNAKSRQIPADYFKKIKLPSFYLPKEFNDSLPPEIKWLHYFERDQLSFCIEKIAISDYKETIVRRNKKTYSDVSFTTHLHIRMSFNKAPLSVGQFQSTVNFTARNEHSQFIGPSFFHQRNGLATAFDNFFPHYLSQIVHGVTSDKKMKKQRVCSFYYVCGINDYKVDLPNIFATAPNSTTAFYQGMDWGMLDILLSAVRLKHENPLEENTIRDLISIYEEKNTVLLSYRNLLLGLIELGLNDALLEKKSIIDTSVAFPKYNDLILELIQKQKPPEELKSHIQSLVGQLKEKLMSINNSTRDPRPPLSELMFLLHQLKIREIEQQP